MSTRRNPAATATATPAAAAKAELRARLAALYIAQGERLRASAFRVLRDRADAEDAVHDVFADLLEREAPLTGDAEAYLRAKVRRACAERLRVRSAEVELPAEADHD